MRRLQIITMLICVAITSEALAKGSPGPPPITISGQTAFGSVLPNHAVTTTLTVTTSTNNTVDLPSIAPGTPFSIKSTTCNGTTSSCAAIVKFDPTLGGDYSAYFNVKVDNYFARSAALTGHGYGPSFAWVTPVYLYGTLLSGTSGSVQMVLNSTGDTPLSVSKFAISTFGPLTLGASSCVGRLIPPGSSCTVDIDYDFTEADPGSWVNATLSVAQSNSGTQRYGVIYILIGGSSGD